MVPESRLFAVLIFLAAALALLGALTAQYGFGLLPCHLCLYQRWPYGAVLILSAVTFFPAMPRRGRVLLLALCALAFFGDAGIALYHTGVEQHWWAGPMTCTGGAPIAGSLDELKDMLAGPVAVVRCDVIAWSLFGISMAGYNIVYASACAVLAACAAIRLKRGHA